jgi:hypothetical protein
MSAMHEAGERKAEEDNETSHGEDLSLHGHMERARC